MISKEQKEDKIIEKLSKTDLTKFIKVNVTVLEEDSIKEGTGNPTDQLMMTVSILDKVSKLLEVYGKMSGKEGLLLLDGKSIKTPEDVTFYSQFALEGSSFILVVGGESLGVPLLWKRFKLDYLTGYDYMSESRLDCISYIPNKNITFIGFGQYANYHSKDMTYRVKLGVDDGEMSEPIEVSKPDSEKDQEKKWHTILLSELGLKPMKIKADQKLHIGIMLNVGSDNHEHRSHFYGYEGE